MMIGYHAVPVIVDAYLKGIGDFDAEKALEANGYHSGFYFTPSVRNDSLYAMKDAKSPQSSSTFQGLTNAVSLFIEIRGIGLGRACFTRRAECGFLVSRSLFGNSGSSFKRSKKWDTKGSERDLQRKE